MVADTNAPPGHEESLREETAMWLFFHHLFRPPAQDSWEWLCQDAVQHAWSVLAERCDYAVERMPVSSDFESYQEEFLAAFDVGMPHPPCPLLESHWNRKESPGLVRQRNMRFYDQFGLRLRSADGSPPDHLRHQLELLQYLCQLELERTLSGDTAEADQIARARSEYLVLHLRSWVPAAAGDLREKASDAWPTRWLGLLAACVDVSASPPPDPANRAALQD
jgi:DMSO reductase family type II enzyme chaperone